MELPIVLTALAIVFSVALMLSDVRRFRQAIKLKDDTRLVFAVVAAVMSVAFIAVVVCAAATRPENATAVPVAVIVLSLLGLPALKALSDQYGNPLP